MTITEAEMYNALSEIERVLYDHIAQLDRVVDQAIVREIERIIIMSKGQDKLHWVTNPTTGERKQITQAQWKNRKDDTSLNGYEREEGADEPDTEEPDDEPGA